MFLKCSDKNSNEANNLLCFTPIDMPCFNFDDGMAAGYGAQCDKTITASPMV